MRHERFKLAHTKNSPREWSSDETLATKAAVGRVFVTNHSLAFFFSIPSHAPRSSHCWPLTTAASRYIAPSKEETEISSTIKDPSPKPQAKKWQNLKCEALVPHSGLSQVDKTCVVSLAVANSFIETERGTENDSVRYLNMTTIPSPLKNSMSVGDSWEVASVSSEEQDRVEPDTPSPSPRHRPNEDHFAESIDAVMVSSSVSGPELIMPSIGETPEATQVQASQTLKQRRQPQVEPEKIDTSPKSESEGKYGGKDGGKDDGPISEIKEKNMPALPWEKPLRMVVNFLLMAALVHLLVLPEIVYHNHHHLCAISAVPAIYPASCSQHHVHHTPGIRPHPSDPYDSVLALQTQLERLFNSTLDEIAPYADTLPATESILQDLQEALDKAQSSGPTHELTLEFDGCREALATASRKLHSLQTDLQSAVDSLMATGKLPVAADNSRSSGSSKDARLSMQMARREKYLDQLAARMRVRADSLTGDFATLADHLESLKAIVKTRVEAGSQRADDSTVYENLRTFVDSLVPRFT